MRPGAFRLTDTPVEARLFPWISATVFGDEPELRCSECHILATVIYLGEGYCSAHALAIVDRAPIYIARTKGLMA